MTEMVWLPDGEKFENIFTRFDRIHEHDGQTDSQTDRWTDGWTARRHRPRLCRPIASRVKNYSALYVISDVIGARLIAAK